MIGLGGEGRIVAGRAAMAASAAAATAVLAQAYMFGAGSGAHHAVASLAASIALAASWAASARLAGDGRVFEMYGASRAFRLPAACAGALLVCEVVMGAEAAGPACQVGPMAFASISAFLVPAAARAQARR